MTFFYIEDIAMPQYVCVVFVEDSIIATVETVSLEDVEGGLNIGMKVNAPYKVKQISN